VLQTLAPIVQAAHMQPPAVVPGFAKRLNNPALDLFSYYVLVVCCGFGSTSLPKG
jgi:hypothetical protein